MGFEPHDLRVMSPTSYQTALPRDILFSLRWNEQCRKPGSNRYVTLVTRDFKSRASANSATPAYGITSIETVAFIRHLLSLLVSLDCLYSIPHSTSFVNRYFQFFLKFLFVCRLLRGMSVTEKVSLWQDVQTLASILCAVPFRLSNSDRPTLSSAVKYPHTCRHQALIGVMSLCR